MVALEDVVKDFSVAKAADFPKHREKEKKKPAPKRKAGTQKAGKGKDKKAKKVEVPAEREVIVIDDDAPDDYVVIDGTIVFID
jgi:stress response protein YsnF